jgi:hypothetical protein
MNPSNPGGEGEKAEENKEDHYTSIQKLCAT